MTKHQKTFHRTSAVMFLGLGLFIFCVMSLASIHTTSQKDARGLATISAIASLVFSFVWIYYLIDGCVSIRSVKIERKSEPKSYWLAMVGWLFVDLAFMVSLIWEAYVLYRHAA
jgi:uncharacterized membrane-anchored protein